MQLVNKEVPLAEFLEHYKGALTRTLEAKYPPQVRDVPRIPELLRPAFDEQLPAVEGLVHALKRDRCAFLKGEMGVGKTQVSAAVSYQLATKVSRGLRAKRVLILTPPHLVEKWQREVEAVVPGAAVRVVERPRDVDALRTLPAPLFAILSREYAKLGSAWVSAFRRAKRPVAAGDGALIKAFRFECPRCAAHLLNDEDELLTPEDLGRKRRRCRACGEALYQDIPKPRRYPLARYIRNRFRHFFDLLIADEAHEYRGESSAQGVAAGTLANSVRYRLPMTGTFTDGKASNVFFLLKRFTHVLDAEYGLGDVDDFVAKYGTYETVEKTPHEGSDHRTSYGRESSKRRTEKPGTSPYLLPYILGNTVFLKLAHVARYLPPYHEEIHTLEMDDAQAQTHGAYLAKAKDALKQRDLDPRARSLLFHSLLSNPDLPFVEETIYGESRNGRTLVAHVPALDDAHLYPKERFILDLLDDERMRGRRVTLFVEGTQRRDVTARLAHIMAQGGFKGAVLKSTTVSSKKREAWLRARIDEGVDALVTNPRCVETGLDLVDFATYAFYQTTYNAYVMRQASKRFYRIGQESAVKGVFLNYNNTLQGAVLQNVATKILTGLALEGDIVAGGVADAASEDMFLKLTRDLMAGNLGTPQNLSLPSAVSQNQEWLSLFNLLPASGGVDFDALLAPQRHPVTGAYAPRLLAFDTDLTLGTGRKKQLVGQGTSVLFPDLMPEVLRACLS